MKAATRLPAESRYAVVAGSLAEQHIPVVSCSEWASNAASPDAGADMDSIIPQLGCGRRFGVLLKMARDAHVPARTQDSIIRGLEPYRRKHKNIPNSVTWISRLESGEARPPDPEEEAWLVDAMLEFFDSLRLPDAYGRDLIARALRWEHTLYALEPLVDLRAAFGQELVKAACVEAEKTGIQPKFAPGKDTEIPQSVFDGLPWPRTLRILASAEARLKNAGPETIGVGRACRRRAARTFKRDPRNAGKATEQPWAQLSWSDLRAWSHRAVPADFADLWIHVGATVELVPGHTGPAARVSFARRAPDVRDLQAMPH